MSLFDRFEVEYEGGEPAGDGSFYYVVGERAYPVEPGWFFVIEDTKATCLHGPHSDPLELAGAVERELAARYFGVAGVLMGVVASADLRVGGRW